MIVTYDNALRITKHVLIPLKTYSKAYNSRCSNEVMIVLHWKLYKTPKKVW